MECARCGDDAIETIIDDPEEMEEFGLDDSLDCGWCQTCGDIRPVVAS